MEKVQDCPALAADGTVKSVPDGSVHGVVDGVQAGDGDQRAGRTAQLGWEVEFTVVHHVARMKTSLVYAIIVSRLS